MLLYLGVFLTAVGVILAGVSIYTFVTLLTLSPNISDLSWGIFCASALSWTAGMLLLTRGRETQRAPFPWLLIPIVALAIALRLSELELLPFGVWYDEGGYGLSTRRFLTDPGFKPIILDNATYLHFQLFQLGARIFGDGNIAGMRIVSAFFGVASVVAAFYVGRLLRGDTFGLIFAFIIAVMRWSINFSRIGMTGVDVTVFVLLTFWALIRLGKSAHLRDVLLTGIMIGLGLWFYRAFQLLLVPLGVYALLVWRLSLGARRLLLAACVGLVTVVIFAQPLGVTALKQPERLFVRVQQTSIFTDPEIPRAEIPTALLESARRHLMMFTISGDMNGRHNLPGAPLLDPVTGALFVAGMLIGIWQIRKPEHIFAFLLIGTSLSAGILSLPSEAPHALRTIGGLPLVAYFAALAAHVLLNAVLKYAERLGASGRGLRALGVVAVCALGVPMLGVNYDVYFNQQRRDLAVWMSFSAVETAAARWLNALPAETCVWASPDLVDFGLSTQYVAPDRLAEVRRLDIPAALPLRETVSAPVMLMFAYDQEWYITEALRLYPNAVVTPIRARDYGVNVHPDERDTLFYSVLLTPDDIASVQGLDGGRGILYTPSYGEYTFYAQPGSTVTINGVPFTREEFGLTLAQGNHSLQLEPADTTLRWLTPGSSLATDVPGEALYREQVGRHGLLASYFPNADWEGDPTMVRLEPLVYRYVHFIPLPRPYSVLWQGSLYAPEAGEYRLGLRAMTEGTLRVDGQILVESDSEEGDSVLITLAEGWHPVEIRQRDTENFSRIYLEWMLPGETTMELIAGESLRPD